MAESLVPPRLAQVGILVRDIEAARASYAKALGVAPPPILVTSGYQEAKTEFRGEASDARAKLCFFDLGGVQLELIEPDENPKSTWREHLELHGEGPHHLAFVVDGLKQKVASFESQGMPLIQKGEYTGGRYAYVDASSELAAVVELLEND